MKGYSVIPVSRRNVEALAPLIHSYHTEWRGDLGRLAHDVQSAEISIAMVLLGEAPIGFVAWVRTYDLNWCFPGGEIIDLFVVRTYRGFGAAFLLLAAAAEGVREVGGSFLSGSTRNPSIARSVQRFAIVEPDGSVYLSGRAFQHIADLSGRGVREILRGLPPQGWNYQ